MTNRRVLPALCAAFLLALGLSACSPQREKTEGEGVAMHMHWLRAMTSEAAQFEVVRAAGVRLVEISGMQALPAAKLKALLDKHELRAIGHYLGELDWAAILPAAKRAGAQWYIIDHADINAPADSIRASADYLKKHLQ